MTVDAYLVWIIAMAIATIAILTVGTLAAAGILRAPARSEHSSRPESIDHTRTHGTERVDPYSRTAA